MYIDPSCIYIYILYICIYKYISVCVCHRSNILQSSRSIYPHIPAFHPPNWRRSLWKPCLQGRKLCPWPWHGVTCQLRHGPAKLNGGSMGVQLGVQWTHRGIRVHSQTIHVWRIHANLSHSWIGNTWEIAPNLVAMAPHSSSWLIGNQHRASAWPNRLLSFWLLTVMWFQSKIQRDSLKAVLCKITWSLAFVPSGHQHHLTCKMSQLGRSLWTHWTRADFDFPRPWHFWDRYIIVITRAIIHLWIIKASPSII